MRGQLRDIAHAHGKTLVDLAIVWLLRQPGLTGAIMGVRNEHEARAMAGGVDWTLTAADIHAVEQALALWEGTAPMG